MLSQTFTTLWWLGFWTAVGLCVGSFLNVVIYRLPRNKSLRKPLWSACPHCHHRIRWYDNLPIFSFVALRGRCRDCKMPISTRYLVIEGAMAIIALMLLDAFFVGQTRPGLSLSEFGLTDKLATDWPILVAHLILFACLVSMSAIDLEHYWVDVRFTNLATIAGFVLHAIWTPRHSEAWIRPDDATAVGALFAVFGLGVVWMILICQPHVDQEDCGESEPGSEEHEEPPEPPATDPRLLMDAPSRWSGWATMLVLGMLLFFMSLVLTGHPSLRHGLRAGLPLFLFFLVIVRESMVNRVSDQEIVDTIQEERFDARRTVLAELAVLLPAAVLGAVGVWLMLGNEGFASRVSEALHRNVGTWGIALFRHWTPLQGIGTAAAGYVIAGALGWIVRIVFTLVFGKEAFGVGDIHLMAAAGCIAGWPVVLLGFFGACGFALVGWLLALPIKRARALPLGPWLCLSFLTVILFLGPILDSSTIRNVLSVIDMLFYDNSQVWVPGLIF